MRPSGQLILARACIFPAPNWPCISSGLSKSKEMLHLAMLCAYPPTHPPTWSCISRSIFLLYSEVAATRADNPKSASLADEEEMSLPGREGGRQVGQTKARLSL
jgi:hypothetical protein